MARLRIFFPENMEGHPRRSGVTLTLAKIVRTCQGHTQVNILIRSTSFCPRVVFSLQRVLLSPSCDARFPSHTHTASFPVVLGEISIVTSPDELGGKIRLGRLANNGKFKMAALEPSLSPASFPVILGKYQL